MSGPHPPADPQTLAAVLRAAIGAELAAVEPVQALWGGYGQLVRCRVRGPGPQSVIVKSVRWPIDRDHPRGWNTDRSHTRKVRSYEVETAWYARYADDCDAECRVPRCLAADARADGVILVLEDLDAAGFDGRRRLAADDEVRACLRWLARFHATFLGRAPEGLWPIGTYWHLETRPDEWRALPEGALKRGAAELDRRLSAARFRTVVHGDAKPANFCFTPDGRRVAAVDFQYVGGGCGMKDVAYLLSSCLDEAGAAREAALLDHYFATLRAALVDLGRAIDGPTIEAEWRALYPLAYADFFRFLAGWSPGHWKMNPRGARRVRAVLSAL